MKVHKVRDEDIEKVGWLLEQESEDCMKLALQIMLALLMEVRNNTKKKKFNFKKGLISSIFCRIKPRVFKRPTGNKKDIITGCAGNCTCRGKK